MKKFSLLLVFLLFISGCSVKRVQYTSYIDTVNQVLEEKINLHNVSLDGYYYYLPKGCLLLKKSDTNSVIKYQDTKIYLYVDIVSYFHKIDNNFQLNNDNYYAKQIEKDGKTGYLQITKVDDCYFVEYMYNYAKLEAFIDEVNLYDAIYQMSIILSSINYHDKILESMVGDNVINYREESFNILSPKEPSNESAGDILDYDHDETYEGFDGEIKDEDSMEIIEDGE